MKNETLENEIYPKLTHDIIFSDRKIYDKGKYIVFDCPQCGKKNKFFAYKGSHFGKCTVASCNYKVTWWDYTATRYGLTGFKAKQETFYKLAELACVHIEKKTYDPSHPQGVPTVRTLHRDFFIWGREQLLSKKGESLLKVILDRGFTRDEVDKTTEICAMPNRKEFYDVFINKKGYNMAQIKDSGLSTYGFGINYQILFPHRDDKGSIVSWAGRLTHAALDKDGNEFPKYKNATGFPKEFPFYLSVSRSAITSSKQVILVEGFMDAIHSYTKGFKNTVAVLGNRLMPTQINHIKSSGAEQILLCLDRDKEGEAGAMNAMELLLDYPELKPYYVVLPPNCKDTDEVLRKYPKDEYAGMLKVAQPGWLWYAERLALQYDNTTDRDNQLAHFGTIYNRIGDPIMKDEFIKTLSERIEIGILTLKRRFGVWGKTEKNHQKNEMMERYSKCVHELNDKWKSGITCGALRGETSDALENETFIPRDPVSIRFKSFLHDIKMLSLKLNPDQITKRFEKEILALGPANVVEEKIAPENTKV